MATHPDQLPFPNGIVVSQVRIARPTNRLDEVLRFYRDGLGLPVIGSFTGHDGYDGVMLGLPGQSYHLEFTRHADVTHCRAPTGDNLLVLYVLDPAHREQMHARLATIHAPQVEPENSYWANISRTYEDPDGWRVVICAEVGV